MIDTFAPRTARPILVVEDEAGLREIVAEGLELNGHTVLQAGNAEDAMELALSHPDLALVISDVRLPGMSGVELADRLSILRGGVRTILMSGYFVPQPIRCRLLSKPFSMDDLEAAIQDELGR
jgi:DNA-binding NtrC family response regulator